MDEDEEQAKKQHPTDHLKPWQYKKGMSGNPNGRPPGSKSLKQYLKERFERMTDDERETFLEGIDKKTIFEMAEGKAKQDLGLSGSINISQVLDSLDNNGPKTEG